MSPKLAAEQTLNAVRRILWETWDPIGVNHHPNISDEYDSYAPAIVEMLARGCTALELERHLTKLRTRSMGLGPPARGPGARLDATVAALLAVQSQDESRPCEVERLRLSCDVVASALPLSGEAGTAMRSELLRAIGRTASLKAARMLVADLREWTQDGSGLI